MCQPRKNLIDLKATEYYHCITRCVRRAFLCGKDELTGKDFSHRRQWIAERLNKLANSFLIEVCAYAIMSNHYHVVLKVNSQQLSQLSDQEIYTRWTTIFPSGSEHVERYLQNIGSAADKEISERVLKKLRINLTSISWFMRALNHHIACRANKEDECKGKFWESRFTSQALLDQTALLSCMTYVDLNPIRAGAADTPEKSDFTSIQDRLRAIKVAQQSKKLTNECQPQNLKKFGTDKNQIHFDVLDYICLVDWTGRTIRQNKSKMRTDLPTIIDRLQIDVEHWMKITQSFEACFAHFAAKSKTLYQYMNEKGKSYCKGVHWQT